MVVKAPKNLGKYRGKWVAIKGDRVEVSGDTLEAVHKKAERKGIKGAMYHHVPTKPLIL